MLNTLYYEFMKNGSDTPHKEIDAAVKAIDAQGLERVIGFSVCRASDRIMQWNRYELYVFTETKGKP